MDCGKRRPFDRSSGIGIATDVADPARRSLSPDERIADSTEYIAYYLSEIEKLLQELAAKPDVDNAQLKQIADATLAIRDVIPGLLAR